MAKTKKKQVKIELTDLKLSFSERAFGFGVLFPQQTNILTGIILRDIKAKVELSQSEMEKFKPEPGDVKGNVMWGKKNDKVKTISFTAPEMKFLKDRVHEIDKQKKISQSFLDVAIRIQEI